MPDTIPNSASEKSKLLGLATSLTPLVQGAVSEKGEIVTVSGTYGKQSAHIQLANSGKNILCTIEIAKASQGNTRSQTETVLSIVPKGSPPMDRGVAVKTGDAKFDASFTARSTNTDSARHVLEDLKALAVAKAVCSPATVVFNASPESVRLVENVANPSVKHFEGRLQAMSMVAGNTFSSKLNSYTPSAPKAAAGDLASHLNIPEHLVKPVLAGAALLILICVGYLAHTLSTQFREKPLVPSGIPAADAALVPRAEEWKIATAAADPDLAQWLKTHPLQAGGAARAELKPNTSYTGYFLNNQRNAMQRIVVLGDGAVQADAAFTGALAMGTLPRTALAGVHWDHSGMPPPDGDGLILFRRGESHLGAAIFYLSDGKVQRGETADVSTIPEWQ